MLRIYKAGELAYNLTVSNLDCTYLNNSAVLRSKACSFYIKNNSRICEFLSFVHPYSRRNIIYYIAFHTINKLKIIHFKLIFCMKSIGKALDYSMVCNSYSLMSPSRQGFKQCTGINYSVHLTHVCMKMKLNPLLFALVYTLYCKIFCFLDALHLT